MHVVLLIQQIVDSSSLTALIVLKAADHIMKAILLILPRVVYVNLSTCLTAGDG